MRLLIGAVIAALGVSPALAHNFNWTRFYIGFEGGGGWGSAQQTDKTPFNSGAYDVSGGLGGIVVGHDWQWNQAIVGVATDISLASIGGDTKGTKGINCIGLRCSADLEWLGTLRARLGWAVNPRFMPYVTGGLAYGGLHGKEGTKATKPLGGEGTETRTGWTAGVGVEARLNDRWTAGLEYLYVDLGDGNLFKTFLGGSKVPQNVSFETSIVRASLIYEFGG